VNENDLMQEVVEIEERTKEYKAGRESKMWCKIPIWFKCKGGEKPTQSKYRG